MQSNTVSHYRSLTSVVCDWSPLNLQQLSQQFSQSCPSTQTTFADYTKYKSYFEPLLYAEVSAELHTALDKYQRTSAPRLSKVRARREDAGISVALVSVSKVLRSTLNPSLWTVDVDTRDRRGPVGCVDSDVVALWLPDKGYNINNPRTFNQSRKVPRSATLAVVQRPLNRTGCRLTILRFPDGNESGGQEIEELGEHNDDFQHTRTWNLLRLGSLTTMKREYDALQNIRNSPLLPNLLKPRKLQKEKPPGVEEATTKDINTTSAVSNPSTNATTAGLEQNFTHVVVSKMGLNSSQSRAILYSSTCRNGFAVIQGPPGTGKTRTLIALLNVVHMTQYQKYYESLLSSINSIHSTSKPKPNTAQPTPVATDIPISSEKGSEPSLLETMMAAMSKTMAAAMTDVKPQEKPRKFRRPRLLVCAPSNSAVDEVLTRLIQCKFFDGHGRSYSPELARIGAGDKVSDSAKPFTAEGQAESFLERVCPEDKPKDIQKQAQLEYLQYWQQKSNGLLIQLERTKKRDINARGILIDLHEKLERMDRDLRRLSIASSDEESNLTREEKLRRIARTYVEDAQLVFATLSGSASSILTKNVYGDSFDKEQNLFDTVVIDEGAQATETSCLIPMALGASRCLLVGDPQQLPATVLASGAAGVAYGQSLLERIFKAGHPVHLLDTQYRMHPAISSFPRRHFYNGKLADDESVQGENRARQFHRDPLRPKLGPYVFLDISEGEEVRSHDDKSIFNPAEAELATLIYSKLKRDYATDSLFSSAAKAPGSSLGFGVVTPYKRQMQELRQAFDRAGIPNSDVEIDTVDSYQGREKDVIIFSCVRTAAINRGIGFVRDVRRMNVGLTRARASLIILGSAQALAEGSTDWAELVEDAGSRGCLITVTDVNRCLMPSTSENNQNDVVESASPSEEVKVNEVNGVTVPTPPHTEQVQATPFRRLSTPIDPRRRHKSGEQRPSDPRLRDARKRGLLNNRNNFAQQSNESNHVASTALVSQPSQHLSPDVQPENLALYSSMMINQQQQTAVAPDAQGQSQLRYQMEHQNQTLSVQQMQVQQRTDQLKHPQQRLVDQSQQLQTERQPVLSLPHHQQVQHNRAVTSLTENQPPIQQDGGHTSHIRRQYHEAQPTQDQNTDIIAPVYEDRNGERDEPSLEEQLHQMTALLSQAGFQNMPAVERTLREHLRHGGELDLETVMAAAIASGASSRGSESHMQGQLQSVMRQGASSDAEQMAPQTSPEENAEVHKLVQTSISEADTTLNQAPLLANQGILSVTNHSVDCTVMPQNIAKNIDKQEASEDGSLEIIEDRDGFAEGEILNEGEIVETEESEQPKESKKEPQLSKKQKQKQKEGVRGKKKTGQPSGWDMLFGVDAGTSTEKTKRGKDEDVTAVVAKRARGNQGMDDRKKDEIELERKSGEGGTGRGGREGRKEKRWGVEKRRSETGPSSEGRNRAPKNDHGNMNQGQAEGDRLVFNDESNNWAPRTSDANAGMYALGMDSGAVENPILLQQHFVMQQQQALQQQMMQQGFFGGALQNAAVQQQFQQEAMRQAMLMHMQGGVDGTGYNGMVGYDGMFLPGHNGASGGAGVAGGQGHMPDGDMSHGSVTEGGGGGHGREDQGYGQRHQGQGQHGGWDRGDRSNRGRSYRGRNRNRGRGRRH